MSQTFLPRRGRCIQITDGTFVTVHGSTHVTPGKFFQLSCVECGHGVHAHVDYESKVVFHNPTTHCAAYAQMTHQSQACSCTVQFFDHEPIVNAFCSIALSHNPALFTSGFTLSNADTSRATVPFQSNGILRFSQSDAYALVSHQQLDGAPLVHDFAGGPTVYHEPEGYYDHQGHSFDMDGAPSADPYA
ncbi:uncharacterized protein ARMOST_07921 [Armillaria ostoyae]|uniref:Uncharacterized protein n=1 Tax=Armillaria ostoyae TaxID=47428 RepID=A0A284R788_ARMOS|nr:uncharacterized protein ARMOST_07921 [Armillaria ostoyae]